MVHFKTGLCTREKHVLDLYISKSDSNLPRHYYARQIAEALPNLSGLTNHNQFVLSEALTTEPGAFLSKEREQNLSSQGTEQLFLLKNSKLIKIDKRSVSGSNF